MAELIWVEPTNTDGKVALYEEDSRHPDGFAWVAGDSAADGAVEPVQVARTPKVNSLLGLGRIRQVSAPSSVEGVIAEEGEAEEEIELEEDVLVKDREAVIAESEYQELTNSELRSMCEERDLVQYGNKDELVERLLADDGALEE